MTFDDWWNENRNNMDGPIWGTGKEIARSAYIAGQADTLETIDPDNFDPLLFIVPASKRDDGSHPGVSPALWEGARNATPINCALWIIIFGIIALVYLILAGG